jgi:hypothetical protein
MGDEYAGIGRSSGQGEERAEEIKLQISVPFGAFRYENR